MQVLQYTFAVQQQQ